jgi:uncharacterized protein (TIGR03000 family)
MVPGGAVPGGAVPGKKIEQKKDVEELKKPKNDKDKDEASFGTPATVVIKAPADVTISFNGQVTTRRSNEESFQTPRLAPGRTYAYQVKAEALRDGKPVTQSKRVTVQGGGRTIVDFTDLGTTAVSSDNASARVTVLVPSGSKLYVDGKDYGTNSRQTFTTPKLEKGKVYYYTVKVENPETGKAQSRRINVEAGKEVTVDLRDRSVVSADR